jgi:hypothetical protein
MLSVILLSVDMLSFIMQIVIMQYAECRGTINTVC